MITILAAVMALGIMPMVAVGVIAPLLIDDLGISRADIGILVGVVAGVSALLSPLVGGGWTGSATERHCSRSWRPGRWRWR